MGSSASSAALHRSGIVRDYPEGYPSIVTSEGAVNFRLFIPGPPRPKGRPRVRVVRPRGGGSPYPQVYTDKATRDWEDTIEQHVRIQVRKLQRAHEVPALPVTGRVLVRVRFNLRRPKSLPKRVKYPVKSRTDLDNMEKSLYDALQNADLMVNDCAITDSSALKRFADSDHPEGVEVDFTAIL